MRATYALVLGPALIGVVLAAFASFAPGTGVNGTPGALLALVGAVAVSLGAALAMWPGLRGWARRGLIALIGAGAVLTAIAAYFLMQYPFALAMALAFLGLVATLAMRRSTV